MAIEDRGKTITLLAGSTISLFTAVKLNAAGAIVPCSVDGEFFVGITQMDGATGDPIPVMVGTGITKALAGEAIAIGDTVGTLNNARLGNKQFSSTGADLGDWVMGTALTSAANGEYFELLLGVPRMRAPLS